MKKSAAMLTLLIVLAMPTASALDNTTFYFVPQDGTASSCGDTVVQLMAHAPYGLNGVQFAINHSTSCIKIVDVEFNTDWWNTGWNQTAMCFGPCQVNFADVGALNYAVAGAPGYTLGCLVVAKGGEGQ